MAKAPAKNDKPADPQPPAAPRYIANFEGDEINGRRYSLGDPIADDVDVGTLNYLSGVGRITVSTTAASDATATGGAAGPVIPPTDPLAGITLSDEEAAARDKLVADNDGNLDKLREIAATEGVEGVTLDQDAPTVATLIIVKRRAA